jgi:hypothetical protein
LLELVVAAVVYDKVVEIVEKVRNIDLQTYLAVFFFATKVFVALQI